jgi:hypothetical protein
MDNKKKKCSLASAAGVGADGYILYILYPISYLRTHVPRYVSATFGVLDKNTCARARAND